MTTIAHGGDDASAHGGDGDGITIDEVGPDSFTIRPIEAAADPE